jgi:hypothetical protein
MALVADPAAGVVGAQQPQRKASVAPLQPEVTQRQPPQLAGVKGQADDALPRDRPQRVGDPATGHAVLDHRPPPSAA